jgi:tRNA pseudouridine38-40 synthase
MRRIKLIVAYDGTNYCGWQIQNNGPTIEGILNEALTDLLKEEIVVTGASRTDAGVHALGNVAIFDTNTKIPPEKISFALNTRLPEDIRIQNSCEVDGDFHPRKGVSVKHYEYKILNRQFAIPTERMTSYFFHRPLDVEAMQKAASYLVGEHDFKSFCSTKAQVLTTVRTIYSLTVSKEGDMIKIHVSGNGFLYNMVRIIAGTLIQAGLHTFEPEYMQEILEAKDRSKAAQTAPAMGLALQEIIYAPQNV